MYKKGNATNERNNPSKGLSELIEDEWRAATTERQPGVSVEGTHPLEAEERPL